MKTKIGMMLKHKPTGRLVQVVEHQEAIDNGFALGMGKEIYDKGITVKIWNKKYNTVAYNFVLFENLEKYFEEE